MRRTLRPVAILALTGLLLLVNTQAGGSPEPSAPPSVTDATTYLSLDAIEARVQGAQAATLEAQARIHGLGRDLAPLEAGLRDAEISIALGAQRLQRRTAVANAFVAGWSPSDQPNLEELSEPLELIAVALHAGDDLRALLSSRVGEVTARRTELDRLEAEARAVRFSLSEARTALEAELVLARRTSWNTGRADGETLVQRIQAALADMQEADLLLRQNEVRIVTLSVLLGEQQTAVQDGLHEARRTEDALIADMLDAESTIAPYLNLLWGSAWGPFDPEGVFEVCPVDMPNAYTDNWGVPRYSGGFHLHQGIDVFAPVGTAIRAPFAGNAVTAENTLGGLAVKVYGALGYVYNAHLDSYGQLGEVQAGDIIGYVGNTGNAIYSAPHDHFEWHPGGGEAVNPFQLLNAACRPSA